MQSALKRGPDRLCSTKCSTDRSLRRRQAIDVAIWRALGRSRVVQRTTPIRAIVLLRTRAAFGLAYRSGGAANIAPVVVTARRLGSAEFEKLSGGSLRLSSQKNARGQSSPELNSLNDAYATAASVKVCGCRPHEGGAARTGAGVRKPPMEETAGGVVRPRVRRYGDLAAVSPSTTFAIWHELCEWVKTPFAAPVISEG